MNEKYTDFKPKSLYYTMTSSTRDKLYMQWLLSKSPKLLGQPMSSILTTLGQICRENKIKLTSQRRTIVQVLEASYDHPDAEELYSRANKLDSKISLTTIYRTLNLLEEASIVRKLVIGDGKSRYEVVRDHTQAHHHLIDVHSGEIIEFYEPELERIKDRIAARLGYHVLEHKFELYGVPVAHNVNKNKT